MSGRFRLVMKSMSECNATQDERIRQDVDHRCRIELVIDSYGQTFSRELIDYVQHVKFASVMRSVCDKVVEPNVVRTLKAHAKALGMSATTFSTRRIERRLASHIARTEGLRAWEGFKLHPDQRAHAAAALRAVKDRLVASPGYSSPAFPHGWRKRIVATAVGTRVASSRR